MKFRFNKFVRQNSRTLLMVVMSLLLVAFLIPQSISGMSRRGPAAEKIGEVYGRSVTDSDVRAAGRDLQLLAQMGMFGRVPDELVLNYSLLLEEARHAGVRVSTDVVKRKLADAGVTDEVLQQIRDQTERSYSDIYETIGRWLAFQNLVIAQTAAAGTSLPRAELAYRDRTQEAGAELSVIDAHAFLHLVPEPGDEELTKFFEECKDRTTAHTEQQPIFGYRYADRVEIEYLTVDPDQVTLETRIKPTQLRQYFNEHAGSYVKRPEPQVTEPTAGPPPQPVPMTYEEAEEQVRQDLRQQKAIEIAQTVVNQMWDEAHRPWATSPIDPNGFREEPKEGVASFTDLQQQFSTAETQQKHAAEYTVEYHKTKLVDAVGLKATATNLCNAVYATGRGSVGAIALVTRVKGLVQPNPRDNLPVFSLGEPMPVVLTRTFDPRTRRPIARQAFLFRVIQVVPSGPPASLDEVRPEVIADWKLLKAFELARQQAETLAARAKEVGLTAAAAEAKQQLELLLDAEQPESQPAAEPRANERYLQELTPERPPNLTRLSPMVGKLGSVSSVQKAIFDLADEPQTDTSPAHRVALVPVASQFKYAVAELLELKPIYAGGFAKDLDQMGLAGDQAEMYGLTRGWFAPENVVLRTGYQAVPPPTTQRFAP